MKYAFAMFLLSRPDEINKVKSIEDLFALSESGNATEGEPDIEKLEELNLILTGSNENFLHALPSGFESPSKLFWISHSFRDPFAVANNDRVSKVTADWADSESWKGTDVNPFDLFGMLHYLSAVCARGRDTGQELFLLLLNS